MVLGSKCQAPVTDKRNHDCTGEANTVYEYGRYQPSDNFKLSRLTKLSNDLLVFPSTEISALA